LGFSVGYNYGLNKEQQKKPLLETASGLKTSRQTTVVQQSKATMHKLLGIFSKLSVNLSIGLQNALYTTPIVNSIRVSTYSQVFFNVFFIFYYLPISTADLTGLFTKSALIWGP
jgi:hypothetical protein